MRKIFLLTFAAMFFLACTTEVVKVEEQTGTEAEKLAEFEVVLPMETYSVTKKKFGEFFNDRFYGYHVGDDLEVNDTSKTYQVFSIANGTVRYIDDVSGYGGVMVIEHTIGDAKINAIYGHIALNSTTLKAGDTVTKAQVLAELGDHESEETDGERKHLHFALYKGDELRLNGYVNGEELTGLWINPTEFFKTYGYGNI